MSEVALQALAKAVMVRKKLQREVKENAVEVKRLLRDKDINLPASTIVDGWVVTIKKPPYWEGMPTTDVFKLYTGD